MTMALVDVSFPPGFAKTLRENASQLDIFTTITKKELQELKDENAKFRQRIYDLEHELGLKKGYR